MRYVLSVVLITLGVSAAAAMTTSGEMNADETWEGVVRITGDVIVPVGRTLTIKPNALIKFTANEDDQAGGYDPQKCELIVEGTLRAEGKEKYEIRFTSSRFTLPDEEVRVKVQPQSGDWYGIVFKKPASNKSIISYSVVEYAYDGVTCVNASPRIFRNRIEANYWNGVLCDVMSAPKINNNKILNNGYAGINCMIGSSPTAGSNEVTGNRYGVLIQDVSQPVIGDVRKGETVGRNAIYSNLEYNLYNHTKNVIYAQRNDWGDNINADRTIRDDDENRKYGIVVYTPIFTSGKVSYSEFQLMTEATTTGADTRKKQLELAALKKQIEEKKTLAAKSKTVEKAKPGSDAKQKQDEEQAKELERLRLLEEQLKQQEQIRIEQEKQLAQQKKEEAEKQKAIAAASEKKETKTAAKTAPTFVATKMANELDNNPKPIKKVSPVIPELAKEAKVSGTVSLRVLVGVDGVPLEVYIAKHIGNKDFDDMITQEAIRTVKQWVFEQGVSGDQPVKYWTIVNLLFK